MIFTILCRDNSDNLPLTLEEWLDEEILVKKSCEYDFPLTKFELKQYRWEIVTIDAIFCDIECYLNDNVSKVSNYEVGKREFISVSDSYVFDSEFNSGRIYLALLLSFTIIVVVLISVYRNSRESVGLGIGTKYPTILKIKNGVKNYVITWGYILQRISRKISTFSKTNHNEVNYGVPKAPNLDKIIQSKRDESAELTGSLRNETNDVSISIGTNVILKDGGKQIVGIVVAYPNNETVTIKEFLTGHLITGPLDSVLVYNKAP